MSEIMTDAALGYLQQGYHLLALRGKRPHPRYHANWSWDDSIHGMPENPDEMAGLDAIFEDLSVTGIAILIPEHILVADIDSEPAAVLFQELVGSAPSGTPIARTTNGLHVWYMSPGANKSLWLGDRTLLFKGFGGYVAVWPSRHFDEAGEQDGTYTWLDPLSSGIDYLPPKLAQAVADSAALASLVSPFERDGGAHPALQFVDGKWTGVMIPEWDLTGLEKAVEGAADGNQNNLIHWAACVARDEGVPFEIAMERLTAAAVRGHHPQDRAVSTIRSAYRRTRG